MKLLLDGGPIFTFPMTLIFLANIVLIVRNIAFYYSGKLQLTQNGNAWVNAVKHIGVILLTLGILGQIIGLYSAFEVIESGKMEITPSILAGGIRVSSITTLLGLAYFVISYGFYAFLKFRPGGRA